MGLMPNRKGISTGLGTVSRVHNFERALLQPMAQ